MAKMPDFEDESEEEYRVFYKKVGARIRDVRNQKKLTQKQVVEHADLKTTYIYLVEGEGQNIQLKTLIKIAKALNVEPRDLMPSVVDPRDFENQNRDLREQFDKLLVLLEGIEPIRASIKKLLDRQSRQTRS